MNKVILQGNVGQEPKIKTFDNGDSNATLTLATSKSWKDKDTGEKKTSTEWHNLVFRGGLSKIVGMYVKKGSKLLVSGEIKYRQYESDGQTKYITEIIVSEMEMLNKVDSPQEKAPAPTQAPVRQKEKQQSADDELPF